MGSMLGRLRALIGEDTHAGLSPSASAYQRKGRALSSRGHLKALIRDDRFARKRASAALFRQMHGSPSMRGRLKALIREDRKARKRVCAFSYPPKRDLLQSLPAELRVMVYEQVLSFDGPITIPLKVRSHKNSSRANRTALLRVSRETHTEALAVLYDINTISVERSAICCSHHCDPIWLFDAKLVRRLVLRNTQVTPVCMAREESLDREIGTTCLTCLPSVFSALHPLRTLPCLREVEIDFDWNQSGFEELRSELRCSGWFCYSPNMEYLDGVRTTFVDVKQKKSWANAVSFSSQPANAGLMKEIFGGKVVFWTAAKQQACEILALHDYSEPPLMPRALADIWPADLPMDLRVVPLMGGPEFSAHFTMAFMSILGRPETEWDMVPRRLD